MVGKNSNSPPGWKSFLSAAAGTRTLDDRVTLSQPVIALVTAVLDEHAGQPPGSQKLFAALGVGTLNTSLAGLDPAVATSVNQLLGLNDVLSGGDERFAIVLVENQFLTSLYRLHQRIKNLSHPLSHAIVLLLTTTTLLAGAAGGSLESVASKPEVLELLISHLTFLSLHPAVLLSPAGLGTAQRCVQLCWELTRASSPHCRASRELLQRIDMAARLMLLSATVMGRAASDTTQAEQHQQQGPGSSPGIAHEAAAAAADAVVAGVASLQVSHHGLDDAAPASVEGGQSAGAQQPASTDDVAPNSTSTSTPDSVEGMELYEERLALAAQAGSLVANLAGLGIRGIELSAAGLAPQRGWLLRPSSLGSLRPALDGLVEGLEGLRWKLETGVPDPAGKIAADAMFAEAAAARDVDADLLPGRVSRRRLLDQVEGAVRNVLFLLGLPTIVMGSNEEDVVEACGFVIRHAFGLYTEGYVDTMRALRAAVADPPTGTAPSPETRAFSTPYPGDYGAFFRAFAGHIETVAPALGVQLEDWSVRFTGEQLARDLPVMQVSEGVDARIAHSWLKGQIQDIINWGHAMMQLVRMADMAKMGPQQRQQQQQQAATAKPAPPRPYQTPSPAPESACLAAASRSCAACGLAPPPGAPAFQACARCRGVRYCSRACQVGHWPQHKPVCKGPGSAVGAAWTAAAAVGAGLPDGAAGAEQVEAAEPAAGGAARASSGSATEAASK